MNESPVSLPEAVEVPESEEDGAVSEEESTESESLDAASVEELPDAEA